MLHSTLWYGYHVYFQCSFNYVAQQHIKNLRKLGFRVIEFDVDLLPTFFFQTYPIVLVHPLFHNLYLYNYPDKQKFDALKKRVNSIIGFDVADSTKISQLAVDFANEHDLIILPSEWAKRVYASSGVTTKMRVIPHGVDDLFLTVTNYKSSVLFPHIIQLKEEGRIILLSIIRHSSYRKGYDLIVDFFKKFKKDYNNSTLLLLSSLRPEGFSEPDVINIANGVSTLDLISIYDIADLYLMFSRGGGFEIPALESISRRVPVLAAKGGAWEEFLPDFCLVDSHTCDYVLKDNIVHIGQGVEISIDKAIDRAHEILSNKDDYRAVLDEYVNSVVAKHYTWEVIAKKIAETLTEI